MKFKFILGSTSALLLVAGTAAAQTYYLNFDAGLSGSLANDQAPPGLSFHYGAFLPDLDGFGDPVPGSDRWQIDLAAPGVTVQDPNFYGRGNAPSLYNALDSVLSPTLLLLGAPTDLSSFSVTLDNDSFGTSGMNIEFYQSGIGGDTLLAILPINQTIPGFLANLGPVSGVNKIVLPGGALYDNVNLTVVPEPAVSALLGLGILSLHLRQRRRV